MPARVLVVDDVPANVTLLVAKLSAAYYETVTATSGAEALAVARERSPDLVLLDVMMPEMDGFEVCRRLKADPATALIPVVMITALDQPADRVRGLEAGADDFLTKPPNDVALFARVRSLIRVKTMIDELRMRDETYRDLGADIARWLADGADDAAGSVLVVEPRQDRAKALATALAARLNADVRAVPTAAQALDLAQQHRPDLCLIAAQMARGQDGLRLCAEMRARAETRHAALISVVDADDYEAAAAALDMGANDHIMRPIDEQELVARARTQLHRKRAADCLRANVHAEMRLAVTDPLTGLHNRRYADQHLARRLGGDAPGPVSVALLDIDHFKTVNDTYGHAAGDEVLIEFARRVADEVRGVDLVCRYGGEEFLVVAPDAGAGDAAVIAERIRTAVAARSFEVSGAEPLSVTVSAGVAQWAGEGESAAALMARADAALYRSKLAGRDRVTGDGADDSHNAA